MDFDPDLGKDAEIYPEVIAVAPDGDRVAVVGHAVSPKRHEFKTILLHSDDFAARAYAQAGYDHLGESRFERAVAVFERAAAAHPNSWERAYDLACARARFGQGNVRRPLSRAIDLGGEKVRTKAQRDSALAGVKRTDWFKAMVLE
jgi:predicted Zn-dependent protease